MQTVTINKDLLYNLLKESVNEVFSGQPQKYTELSDDFPIMANRLATMAQQLNGFVEEYPKFIEEMMRIMSESGLKLEGANTTDSFEMEDLSNGKSAEFTFRFVLPGVDVANMTDDEYMQVEEKINEVYDQVDVHLNSRNFYYGNVQYYALDDGIEIDYSFNFWQ